MEGQEDKLLHLSFQLRNFDHYWRKKNPESSIQPARIKRAVGKDGAGGFRYYAIVLLMVILHLSAAAVVAADNQDEKLTFNIPRQRADLALVEFAKQADVTFMFSFDEARQQIANRLIGNYTRDDAIDILLKGTGLKPEFKRDGVLTVHSDHITVGRDGMNNKTKSGFFAGLGAAVLSVFTSQGVAEGSQESQASGKSRTIEEVIVTAQKREAANIQDVPLSISAISGEDMERLGYEGFTDYLPKVPGLSFIDRGPGQTKIIMRGISSSERSESAAAVAVYLDEVPVTSPGAPVGGVAPFTIDVATFDLERVEVLRGPQGTLFGAGSMGGTVRLITNKPNSEKVEAKGDVTVSTTRSGGENYNLNGMINIPIIQDKLAARIVGYDRNNEGFIDNVGLDGKNVNDEEATGARFSLRYEATEALSITGKINYQKAEVEGASTDDSDRGGYPNLIQNRFAREGHEDESIQYNLMIEYNIGWGNLLSSTAYQDRETFDQNDQNLFFPDAFGFVLPGANWQDTNDVQRVVQEIRFASTWESPFQTVFGVYYFDQDQALLQRFPAPGFDAVTGINTGAFGTAEDLFEGNIFRDITELAFFGELTYDITERIQVTAGFRWFDIDQEFRNFSQGFFNGGQTSGQLDNAETGVTPKFSLSYRASDDILLYATASQGYRFGGISEIVPAAACGADLTAIGLTAEEAARFDSDSLWNYELGIKSEWFNRRLIANVSAFHIDWSDIQTSRTLPCFFGFIENAGGATSDGIEWELTALPADNLELNFSGSYTEAEFEATPNLGAEKGDRLPGAPRLTLNTSAQYNFPITSLMEGYLRLDYQYTANRINGFNSVQRQKMDSYNIANIRAGLLYKNWQVSLFAKNLFDEQAQLSLDPLFGVARNRPRTVGVQVRWNH